MNTVCCLIFNFMKKHNTRTNRHWLRELLEWWACRQRRLACQDARGLWVPPWLSSTRCARQPRKLRRRGWRNRLRVRFWRREGHRERHPEWKRIDYFYNFWQKKRYWKSKIRKYGFIPNVCFNGGSSVDYDDWVYYEKHGIVLAFV